MTPDQMMSLADWAVKGVVGLICVQGVNILSGMKKSIDELNKQMIVIVERTTYHSKEIDRLDSRLTKVEEMGT